MFQLLNLWALLLQITTETLSMMNENEIKDIIENKLSKFEDIKHVERVQYIMDFGKVYIQYDFCLN